MAPIETAVDAPEEVVRERFRADGYVFVRQLFDRGAVEELRDAILAILSSHDLLSTEDPPEAMRPGGGLLLERADDFWPVYREIQRLESFHRLAHDPTVVAFLGTLFGDEAVVHPRKIARVNYPAPDRTTTPFHQDFPLIGGTVDFVTVWTSLAPLDATEGGLRVLPTSFRRGVRPVHFDPEREAAGLVWVDVDDAEEATAVCSDVEAGDAFVFHSLLVHAGIPNRSSRVRLSVDYRYQPVSEPIGRASTVPHYARELTDDGTWRTLVEGWETDRWVDVPAATRVVDGQLSVVTGDVAGNLGAAAGASRLLGDDVVARQVAGSTNLWPAHGR